MVTVKNVRAGAYYNRETGHTNVGDQVDVSESFAQYLCDKRGDFVRVECKTETVTCSGNDGDCSRSVDEVGDVCWQHQD